MTDLEINVRSWNIGAGVAEWTKRTASWAKANRIAGEFADDGDEVRIVCVVAGATDNKKSGIWFVDIRHSPRAS